MTIAVLAFASIGLAALARRLCGVWDQAESSAVLALGLGLALAVPLPWSLVPFVLALALAILVQRAKVRVERERESVAAYLATVQVSEAELARGTAPAVDDAIAQRALVRVEERALGLKAALAAERAARAAPTGVRARFMAAMGHELRSPLNSIMGFAQLLEDGSEGPLTDAQRENVVLVRRAAHELLTLLTDILDTARVEAGRVQLDRQWIAPIEVLTMALARVKEHPETEGLAIEAEVQPGLGPLHADRARLAQALSNVLRAVARSGAPLEARVREVREGEAGVVRFEVHDRSRAISAADAARAFDPDPAARPQGRSLALGLALSVARDLAQLHGGDARAESVDHGTSWIVWVPAQAEAATPRPRGATPLRGGRGR